MYRKNLKSGFEDEIELTTLLVDTVLRTLSESQYDPFEHVQWYGTGFVTYRLSGSSYMVVFPSDNNGDENLDERPFALP